MVSCSLLRDQALAPVLARSLRRAIGQRRRRVARPAIGGVVRHATPVAASMERAERQDAPPRTKATENGQEAPSKETRTGDLSLLVSSYQSHEPHAALREHEDRAMRESVHDEVHFDGSAVRDLRAVTSELRASRGGRPASGSVRWSGQCWTARITLADGSRRTVPLDANIPKEDRAAAQACAARVSELVRAQSIASQIVTPEANEMSTWFSTWCELRTRRGQTSVREVDAHYRVHITPVLGTKPIRLWTPDDLRALSRSLDAKVQAGALSWKTASNVWGTASKMCTDAVRSKDDRIRVRGSNPVADVAGPDRGAKKAKQYLYPSEFARFVASPEVPLRWRRLVALLVYLYPRPGELRELRWDDVDLEHADPSATAG